MSSIRVEKDKCICDDYLSYHSTVRGIVAALMQKDECVNCYAVRRALNALKYSDYDYNREGLLGQWSTRLNIDDVLSKLKTNSDKRGVGDRVLFLNVFHGTGKILSSDYSLEDAASDIVEKNHLMMERIAKYLS
ncbi:hypothetical protein [Photobacterium kishitanii]|uniref:Uncharacterized protein n=1 Tax=Photobacterium kishitanii TaxID=318456 RepID=A0A2T3KM51_9GAMM|nr:hypothetical protein [Photobacterium kishitanii]PSV00879.1 hypothetical protein C9J27_02300 [Photobacterium kishitanii]